MFCEVIHLRCEYDYCIYNEHFSCILREIQINSLGMCDECIIVTIPEENLELMKEKQLKELEERWK